MSMVSGRLERITAAMLQSGLVGGRKGITQSLPFPITSTASVPSQWQLTRDEPLHSPLSASTHPRHLPTPVSHSQTGPIYRMRLGLQEVVVVSSADHAIELLDRRSPIYSSRPRQVMAEELLSRGLRLTFMP